MIKINKNILKNLNPCADRYKNFLKHYPKFNGSFLKFLDLPNISYSDKIWVAQNLLNINQLVQFGILTATSVIHIYEKHYPNDKRIHDCLEYLTSIDDFTNLSSNQRKRICEYKVDAKAAYVAAPADAAYYAYYATAYAAANAAAYAVYAAAAAADYATVAAYAAYAANSSEARIEQEEFNIELLKIVVSM